MFDNEKDPIPLIKIKELYEVLEMATDKAEDAANVLEAVVLEERLMAFCFDISIPAEEPPPVNTGLLLLIITVAVALAFDFLNGFHDAANSIATVVSTRVLVAQAGGGLGGVL